MTTPSPLERLRKIAQTLQTQTDPTFLNDITSVGFESLSEAIQAAHELNLEAKQEQKRAGSLVYENYLYKRLKQQVRKDEKVVIAFQDIPGKTKLEKQLNLGRMRALARYAALQEGYEIPQLENDGRFETIYQDRVDYDTWGTRYTAKCVKRREPFWLLSKDTQKQLIELAKRKLRH